MVVFDLEFNRFAQGRLSTSLSPVGMTIYFDNRDERIVIPTGLVDGPAAHPRE
jgi:hypothetical protein